MNHRLAASHDAINSSSCVDADDAVFWLEPYSARQSQPEHNAYLRHWFLGFTVSLGLGAGAIVAAAGTAAAPAVAHTTETAVRPGPAAAPNEPHLGQVAAVDSAPIPVALEAVSREQDLSWNSAATDLLANHRDAEQAPGEQAERDANEILQFGKMRVPRWIVETIIRAAEVTGVDPVYMMALADKESSFLPSNKASTSSAEGLFQFIVSTWLEVVRDFGANHGLSEEAAAIQSVNGQLTITDEAVRDRVLRLRRDPYLSALMAAEMLKRDRAQIERRIGRNLTRSELYLAHFLGVQSAGRLMEMMDEKPKQSAPRVFPQAARANRTLFFAKKGRKTRHLSVAEVYDKIDQMIDKRLDRYEGLMAFTAADASL